MLKNLKIDRKADLKVTLDPSIKYAVTTTEIKINPKLPKQEFDVTMGHELLHYMGIPHAEHTRAAGYSSSTLRKDHLSKAIAKVATR